MSSHVSACVGLNLYMCLCLPSLNWLLSIRIVCRRLFLKVQQKSYQGLNYMPLKSVCGWSIITIVKTVYTIMTRNLILNKVAVTTLFFLCHCLCQSVVMFVRPRENPSACLVRVLVEASRVEFFLAAPRLRPHF